eukprot:12663149-Ditylum_brightwellii.AAC.1
MFGSAMFGTTQTQDHQTFIGQSTALTITVDTRLSNVEASIASNTVAVLELYSTMSDIIQLICGLQPQHPTIGIHGGLNPAPFGHPGSLPVTATHPLPTGSEGQ